MQDKSKKPSKIEELMDKHGLHVVEYRGDIARIKAPDGEFWGKITSRTLTVFESAGIFSDGSVKPIYRDKRYQGLVNIVDAPGSVVNLAMDPNQKWIRIKHNFKK